MFNGPQGALNTLCFRGSYVQDIRGDLKTYSKQDIAIEYLNLALVEYVKGTNMFAALNLAGAAEEMLGKIVRLNWAKSAHDKMIAMNRTGKFGGGFV